MNYKSPAANMQFQFVVEAACDVFVNLKQSDHLEGVAERLDCICALCEVLECSTDKVGKKCRFPHRVQTVGASNGGVFGYRRDLIVEIPNCQPGAYTIWPQIYKDGEERGFAVEVLSSKPLRGTADDAIIVATA